ncbi:odorant receptor 9a-like isoform X2 [Hylaeus volcanicus]|uniref:odorant receptor 9a-like isoform X2 n=1 Tax=Hylaeus volcanicus TaxID=313075 RepID=UPI0023B7D1C6|nr:odorant receptor 9a-like isoform X2 [Hylaeus volcanicus]
MAKNMNDTEPHVEINRLDDNPNYKIVMKDLFLCGQHPRQKSFERVFRSVFLSSSVISMLIPIWIHFLGCIMAKDMDGVLYAVPILNTDILSLIKLGSLILNRERFLELHGLIIEEWNTVKTKDEIRILDTITRRGSKLANMYRIAIFMTALILSIVPLFNPLLDVIKPLNESRPRPQVFEVDYHIDNDEYFYPIMLHLAYALFILAAMIYSVDSQYMVFSHHACALFALCGYELKRAMENFGNNKNAVVEDIYKQIKDCILLHKKALRFYELLNDMNRKGFLLTIGMNMISISMTMVQLVIYMDQPAEQTKIFSFLIAQLFHVFFISLPGQRILDYSFELAENIYGSTWYETPIRVQRLLLIMKLRCSIPCQITAGGLYNMNMENFGNIFKTSMSYFTMLTSVRE